MIIKGRNEVKKGPCVAITQAIYEATANMDNWMDTLYIYAQIAIMIYNIDITILLIMSNR